MRLGSTIAAAGVAALIGAGAAQAAPMTTAPMTAAPMTAQATLQQAVYDGNTPHLELVRGGCGWGAHRTWHGYCHLNYGWRGRVRAWRSWHRW